MTKEGYYEKHDRMPFGKHKGESIKSVIIGDPFYMRWVIENLDFVLSNETYEFYEKALESARL